MSAVTLYHRHTVDELVAMAEAVRADPANRSGGGLHLYTARARQRLNAIGWAIHYHLRDEGAA